MARTPSEATQLRTRQPSPHSPNAKWSGPSNECSLLDPIPRESGTRNRGSPARLARCWCVKHTDGWCACKINRDPGEAAWSVETLCDHVVMLP